MSNPNSMLQSLNSYMSPVDNAMGNTPQNMNAWGMPTQSPWGMPQIQDPSVMPQMGDIPGGGGGNLPSFTEKMQGWGNIMGGVAGLGNVFLGKKQYDLAKQGLNESKRQFQLNYDNQSKLTNARLSDRQDARVANNPNMTSTADYMAKYGV